MYVAANIEHPCAVDSEGALSWGLLWSGFALEGML